jgi:hypothetical protein
MLEYNDKEITVYYSEPGSNFLKETARRALFHIGAPDIDASDMKESLQKALNNLLKYYL